MNSILVGLIFHRGGFRHVHCSACLAEQGPGADPENCFGGMPKTTKRDAEVVEGDVIVWAGSLPPPQPTRGFVGEP